MGTNTPQRDRGRTGEAEDLAPPAAAGALRDDELDEVGDEFDALYVDLGGEGG